MKAGLIALEEAFTTSAHLEALAEGSEADAPDLDLEITRFLVSPNPHARRLRSGLLDLGPGRLQIMDEVGIRHAVLSLMSPGVQTLPTETAVALARATNEALEEAITRYPHRFSGFAAVAPQDPAAAAAEIDRVAEIPGFRGVLVNSHTDGVYLDDPRFAPLLEACERHRFPLYIHPRNPPGRYRQDYRPDGAPPMTEVMWGFHAETSFHAARLIVSGTMDRHPGLTVILGHLGEGLPMHLFRMQGAATLQPYRHLQRSPWRTFLDQFRVTTSGLFPGMAAWKTLSFCIDLLGPERVLYAADYPFADPHVAMRGFVGAPLDDSTRAMIGHENAVSLLGPLPEPPVAGAPMQTDPPPNPHKLMQMITGGLVSQTIHVACRLKIADHLVDGPATVEALAEATHSHPDSLYRLLRYLASHGIFAELPDGRFRLTPDAALLRSDSPAPIHAFSLMFSAESAIAVCNLMHSVKTGETAFEHTFGQPQFDWLAENPEEQAIFARAMKGIHGRETAPMIDTYDFGRFEHIVDVGGSTGDVMIEVLKAFEQPKGTVFDLPGVADAARHAIEAAGLGHRCAAVGGSFFESVPAGADCYFLRHIIHDWREDLAVGLLERCRDALLPDARILVVETILPPGNEFHPGKLFDLTMLALPGGRERNEAEYHELAAKAGLAIDRIVPLPVPVSIIELVRA